MKNDKADRNFPAIRLADGPQADNPAETHKRMLSELAERLDQYNVFAKGQFVMWKPGLKNRKFPDYGEPSIVTAVLPTPHVRSERECRRKPLFSGAFDTGHRDVSRRRFARIPCRWAAFRAGRRLRRHIMRLQRLDLLAHLSCSSGGATMVTAGPQVIK